MKNKLLNAKLNVFNIAMISVAGIFTLRTLPLMAEYGLASVFYYVIAALLFLIPSAFMCAELATGWPKTGGLYVWVREAFGPQIGFLAIWFEWSNTVISFPATLSFIVATLAYAINPALIHHKTYMLTVMLLIFWGTTFINFLGIKFSSWISNLGLIFGTILPCILILSLSLAWLLGKHPVQIDLSVHHILPSFDLGQSSFIVGLLLGYAGMQVAAFHAQEVENPQRDFPRAIFIAVLMILGLSIFGSLAIAIVVPQHSISLVAGLMQAAQAFFTAFHMSWFIPIIAVLTAIGTLAMLNLWIIGPCKGLLATAKNGDLPKFLQKTNQYGAPTTILLLQAIVGTLFSCVYFFMPTVNSSYWILVDLTALLTLVMYILMFASVIRLRYTQPDTPRGYRIPGGKVGLWLICGTGIVVCGLAFFLGFIPPSQLKTGNIHFYEFFLVGSIIILASIPFIVPKLKIKKQEVVL